MQNKQWTDAQLAGRILDGDDEAFSALVARFHRTVYSIAYRMSGNAAEAEDLSQEIFLRIYKNLDKYDPSMPLAPWINRLACNHILNRLKRRAPRMSPLEIEVEGEEKERPIADKREDPEEAMIAKSRKRQLQSAIMSLPENYRIAFTLKYVEDLTADEISEIMQIPRNTIKTWLVRAREMLRSKLSNEM